MKCLNLNEKLKLNSLNLKRRGKYVDRRITVSTVNHLNQNPKRRRTKHIRDYMKSPVVTVTSDTLIQDAQKMMQEYDIRYLPVVDKGKLVGLITQDRI